MTPTEFKHRLNALGEVLSQGLAYYAVWQRLALHDPNNSPGSLDQMNDLLGRFRGFFTPIGHALLDGAYLQFAKAFDKKGRTASLGVLLEAAKKDATLVAMAALGNVKKISDDFDQDVLLLRQLKRRRDQYIAHVQANPGRLTPVIKRDFDAFVERVKAAFNALSVAHDGNVYSWDQLVRTSGRDTAAVLRILLDEMDRRQKQHDENMATIALDAIRDWEKTMERSPDKMEVREIIQGYGLTGEQKRRVEEQQEVRSRS